MEPGCVRRAGICMEVSQKVAIQHHLIESLLKELVRAFADLHRDFLSLLSWMG